MKRTLLVFSLAVCLLVSSQAHSFAEIVTSKDDPGFDGGTVTVAPDDYWYNNPEFNSGTDWQPVTLTAEEQVQAASKEKAIAKLMLSDQVSRPDVYNALARTEEGILDGTLPGTLTDIASSESIISTPIPKFPLYVGFKIPNYNQGATPYCGPFSALQILRYKRYYEPNLLRNLIREMYIKGRGSNIYYLAWSLRKRLRYPYYPLRVYTPADYAYKHLFTVAVDRMPIDNLVRIYSGQLGKYRRYHSGHYIDSNGAWFDWSRRYLYITDTYQEYAYGTASGTLGGQWVSFLQMYYGVRRHPLQRVVC